ncbi:hypothetical protein [Streptomyces sp. NPDC003401]
MTYPARHARPPRAPVRHHRSPVTYVLLITAPAAIAVAALRPR